MRFRHFRSACKWGKCFRLLQQFYWFSQKLKIISIFTTRKRSLGQCNIFSSVCQEFCSQGGGSTWAGTHPQAGTPPLGRYTPSWAGPPPPGQVHPLGRYPLGRYTPQAGTPPREQCMLGDMGNKRAVRILLECILVVSKSGLVINFGMIGLSYFECRFFFISILIGNFKNHMPLTFSITLDPAYNKVHLQWATGYHEQFFCASNFSL